MRYQRYGLNGNIRSGIDFAFEMGNEAVIVLEDDLLLADDAIEWLAFNLRMLKFNKAFASVSLLTPTKEYPFRCWGWGMHKNIWQKLDWSLRSNRANAESWDCIVNENFIKNNWVCFGSNPDRVKHIGWYGMHYKWFSVFAIRSIYKKWKNNYYRDKDLLMTKEKFPNNIFRWFL